MLTITEKTFDLGDVKFGNIVSRDLQIKNSSNLEIVINPIGTSCSCTSGVVHPNPIPAGAPAVATISFNSSKVGKGDMMKSGVISWVVDNKYHSHTFKFKVNVI